LFETADGLPIGVLNLIGRVFMDPAGDPFAAADEALSKLGEAKIVVVDMHAEATSEKRALGLYLDGRVSVVVGTHTHVPTADEQILPGGTAYQTDLGMTGPHDSVIGMRKDTIVERFTTGMPQSFKLASGGARLQGAIVEVDASTGRAASIIRLDHPLPG
jgi:metallophosphoesterase (TIGR00282 family)